ncbi:MAG TPA: serine/threonine-protein kinase [Kofleriaceae bacterium]|nr:serine/threonine-protein kinase [Kofleriaceae bacterium]
MGGAPEEPATVESAPPLDPTDSPTTAEKPSAMADASKRPPMPPSEVSVDKGSNTSGTSVGSPIEALERDEILRTRTFSVLVIVFSVTGAGVALIVPGGDPRARSVMLGGCVVALASMLFMLYQTYDPVRFRKPLTSLVWFVPSIVVMSAVFFFGVFSPAPMLVVLGIYFVGLSKAGRMAIASYVTCAALYTGMSLFILFGGSDFGVLHPTVTPEQHLLVLFCVQLVLALTIVIARLSRRTALLAVGELEQATRLAAHRQALLLEAREELDRALRTKRGRFSDQVIGNYQLGDVLGRGAMGEVYAATDIRTRATVAIKLLSQASLGNAHVVMRFFRELRTAATVHSPHVVRVIEVGENPVPYLVMERLEGETLSELLRRRRMLPPAEVLELIDQIAIGVGAAAAAGIVHRDLKPQNVFKHRDAWKVLDFGVARAIDQGDTLTGGQVVGTPAYMAPEQASGGTVDHRTDLYALAAIAYRALTGHPPFSAGDIAQTLYRVVHTRPTRPTLLAPELPVDIDVVLAIGMALQPADRFASGEDFASALRAAVDGTLPGDLRERAAAFPNGGWGSSLRLRRAQ